MTFTKTDSQKYTRKLYRFLRDHPAIEFKKLRKNRGNITWTRTDDVTVELDYREEILSTLIHEFLHFQHKDWTEEQIIDMEFEVMEALTDRQIRTIIKRFAAII